MKARLLKENEIIRVGDEYKAVPNIWITTTRAGTEVTPGKVGLYRRLMKAKSCGCEGCFRRVRDDYDPLEG